MKQNLYKISHSPQKTLTTYKITQAEFLEDNKGRIKLKGREGKGIYKAGKPMGTAGKVLNSRVRLVLLRHMFDTICKVRRTISRVRLVVPRRTSVYYL